MMELYQAFADYTEMIEITEALDHAGRHRRDRHVGRHRARVGDVTSVDLAAAVATGADDRPRRAKPSVSRCTRRCRSTHLRELAEQHGVAVNLAVGHRARSSRSCSRRPPNRR